MEDGLLRISGAQEPAGERFISLATIKFIGGLQTQRSAFASIDTRYSTKFLGGKPDALIAGSNVEINNKLTLQRRPGLVAYGTSSIEPPKFFYSWQLATTADLILIVDTATTGANSAGRVRNYSPTQTGVYFDKATGSGQTSFMTVVNTLYAGNGKDLYKIIGPNLLQQSNTFGSGAGTLFAIQSPWTDTNVFSMTTGQTDPLGGTAATGLVWSVSGPTATLEQDVTPNYTPIASNTFTFSLWMKQTGGAVSIDLVIKDQTGTIATQTCALTTSWVKYSVTGTMASNSNVVKVFLQNPTTTNAMAIYGAQLEVGGPATVTQITTTHPQGVYLWGITAPTIQPTLATSAQTGSTGQGWQPNHVYAVGDYIVDTNGNIEYVSVAGTSGTGQPSWSTQIAQTGVGTGYPTVPTSGAGTTSDGIQNSLVQSNSSFVSASTISLAFLANVAASNTLVAFVFADIPNDTDTFSISDNNGNLWSAIQTGQNGHGPGFVGAGDFHMYCYSVRSAAAGATTVTVTISNPSANSIWLVIAEINGLVGSDVTAYNGARDSSSTVFYTGLVTTTNQTDMLFSFAVFGNNTGFGTEIGNPPTSPPNWLQLGNVANVQGRSSGHYMNMWVYYNNIAANTPINPLWTITNPGGSNGIGGITAAFKTITPSLVWVNLGPTPTINGVKVSAGLSPTIGYQYYYAFMNSQTGHVSNVSPISQNTGQLAGQAISITGVGMQTVTSGPASTDPQVDTIAVFRNTDGGSFFFQIATFANPGSSGSAGTWTLKDLAVDTGISVNTTVTLNSVASTITEALNSQIYAPVGLLNSTPPAGLTNLEYFAGRMWGSVKNLLYYNTAADNAALINILQNGVAAESWAGANVIPFNAPITRSVAIGGGLLVFTALDTWFVTGQNLVNGGFTPQKTLIHHGVRSYNAIDIDGSSVWLYTSDRQFLVINPNSGSIEMGYPIGDVLDANYDPTTAYVARHVSGSQDNCAFLADGTGHWYRVNPNQQGASMQGEATPVWSPQADFTGSIGGIGAIASIETAAGTFKFLVGQTSAGAVLARSLTTFTDNATAYTWSATIGSILLTTPGKLAETESITTEMNNVSSAATQCSVSVLLDEISGSFESLPNSVSDPPALAASSSVLSNRFYLSQGTVPPICRHIQIKLSGAAVTTKDEILAITIRGALVPEEQY